ncbi:MAG: AAA family ATPase [Zoogloeaceae bacterium]|jgi:DNA transposition AAA+ family ATPase|nr:AAA family ATPase [Zoogloeaceae bacterium]
MDAPMMIKSPEEFAAKMAERARAAEKEKLKAAEKQQMRAENFLAELQAAGVSQNRMALETEIPAPRIRDAIKSGDLSEIAPALLVWKERIDTEEKPDHGIVQTPTLKKIIAQFSRCREMGGLCGIFGAAGAGKTMAALLYMEQQDFYPHTPVVLVPCNGMERSLAAFYRGIKDKIIKMGGGMWIQNPESAALPWIGNVIGRGGLLILDETQFLRPKRYDELRCLSDEFGIGIAFMGNLSAYASLKKGDLPQVVSRMVAPMMTIENPSADDVDALMEAWELRGKAMRDVALLIGCQNGGLRNLGKTRVMAQRMATLKGCPITPDIFKAAAIAAGVINEA